MVVAAVTRKLGINAAFLQEIKDSHPDLGHTLRAVREACCLCNAPAATAKQLVRLLDELRDCLAFQFALEESYGYLEGVSANDAVDSSAVGTARKQHCALYLELSGLCEQAEELQYRGFAADHVRELIAATQAFDERLVAHERLEAELVERFYRRRTDVQIGGTRQCYSERP